MELPEQDRQAFIDAARRRTQPQEGGAAFGVYPSSGKRPEKLNVSRDVNMPAQAGRGWVAGTLGLPGDIEGLGRMLINMAPAGQEHERVTGKSFVGETPVLPTSDFYREWLPGGDERPAAQFASGLGALAGGAGSTKVAGAAVKGAKATGKALGPKAAEMAESYLKKSGLAPELIAYQGSPHKFAPEPDAPFGKFRSEKIGTGEGAQAYGQGHYLAEAPEVAKGYRDRLSGSNYVNAATGELAESGKAWTDATKAVQDTGINKVQHPDRAGSIASQIQDWVDSGKTARSFLLRHTVPKELEPAYEAAIDSFDLYRKNKGYLYTVDVPDEMIGKMLDWDRPLSQQPEALKPLLKEIESVGEVAAEKIRALAQQPGVADWAKRDLLSDAAQVAKSKSPAHVAGVLKRMQLEYGISPDSGAFQEVAPDFLSFVRGMQAVPNMDTGGGAVSFLQARYGDKGASEMLRQAGIPGIKYLDEGSRGPSGSGRWNIKFPDGTEQIFNFKPNDDVLKQMNATAEPAGTRNFVIFPGEEESVKIIDRKAEGGLVQDTDAIVAQLKGMDKDKALTHALRMANAKQEAHMQAGGLATLFKGAKAAKAAEEAAKAAKPAQIGNYQALPLQLPRAPNLPAQELTKTADRIARQQTGQHVRKSATEAQNLAGRSMKEVERLKNLDIQIQRTKDLPTPSVVPEEFGQVRIALPGDISVADQILMSVNDLPIGAPQEGGPMYGLGKMDLEDPRFWASNEGPAQIFQNKVTDLANLYETPEILAQHLAMAHDAMNFAQHFADASLRAMQQMPVHPESAREFNKIIREGYEKINPRTKERVRIGFPTFPGVENYGEAYKALKSDPEMRKWFNNRMKVEKITDPLGLPSGKQIEYAIMEPELRNMEHSMTGLSVGRMKPGASLIPGSEHATYSHDIAGQALGRTKELTPLELAFPDASAYIRRTQRPQDFTGTIQKVFPHQVVDEQYINQLGEYYNRLKQIRGYKKGGAVEKSGLSVLNKAII